MEYYMVEHDVWAKASAAKPKKHGMLCIGCLESRLGRQLTPADFPTRIPLNHMIAFDPRTSDRLLSRLHGIPEADVRKAVIR